MIIFCAFLVSLMTFFRLSAYVGSQSRTGFLIFRFLCGLERVERIFLVGYRILGVLRMIGVRMSRIS